MQFARILLAPHYQLIQRSNMINLRFRRLALWSTNEQGNVNSGVCQVRHRSNETMEFFTTLLFRFAASDFMMSDRPSCARIEDLVKRNLACGRVLNVANATVDETSSLNLELAKDFSNLL